MTAFGTTELRNRTAEKRVHRIYSASSSAAGDFLNNASFAGSLVSDLYVHPGIDSIAGVSLDDRYRRKISSCPASDPRSESGVSASHRPCTYAGTSTPIPTIRNVELVLLRAEAESFT